MFVSCTELDLASNMIPQGSRSCSLHDSAPEAGSVLRTWREEGTRDSYGVVRLWESCMCCDVDRLGDEKWMVLEQTVVAALDVHRLDIAEECLVQLAKRFPGSLRVRKLKALRLEALERYDDAQDIYEAILRADENNTVARKRLIALHKARNDIPAAIAALVEYLNTFMSDSEAWDELCDLYIHRQEFAKAAFCMEELLLHNPHYHLYFQKYADIRYTQGGLDNIELARSYYAQAIKLSNVTNIRAMYGLLLCCSHVANSPKVNGQKKKDSEKMAKWVAELISNRYEEVETGSNMEDVESMLSGFSLAG